MGTDGYAQIAAVRYNSGSWVSLSSNVGRIHYERGVVEIDANILRNAFAMTFVPKTNTFEGIQDVVAVPSFKVTITAETQ